jgi:hypothetical protein
MRSTERGRENAAALAGARGAGYDRTTRPAKHTTVEAPEHRGDRRRFLVWAVLAGFAEPDRLTERIVAEIEQEART